MNEDEARALRALRFNWALTSDDVWDESPFHVDGLHPMAERYLAGGVADASSTKRSSPIGVVIEGQGGTGKTHLLGWVRREIQRQDGYFFLVDFSTGTDFWANAALQMRSSLQQLRAGTDKAQLGILLRHLALLAGLSAPMTEAVSGIVPATPSDLKAFVQAISKLDRQVGLRCQETLRGLALYASDDLDLQVLGDNFLASRVPGDSKEEQRRIDYWLSLSPPPPKAIVEQMSRIVALSGPSVIAIDQIDALLSPAVSAGVEPGGGTGGREPEDGDIERGALDVVAGGLMDLRQITSRTLCVVSCLTTSWRAIRTRAVTTAQDRFRSSAVLGTMSEAAIVRLLVERRFGHFYRTAGFTPPHPTWPIAGSAFAGAVDRTPRAVLQAIDKHVDGCLARRRVVELTDFDQVLDPEDGGHDDDEDDGGTGDDGDDGGHDNGADSLLDERYRQLVAQFDVGRVLDPEAEDVEIPRLLASGLHAWAIEQGDGNRFKVEALAGKRPHLHARLRQILDPETERQIQWSYRAIAQSAARAVQSRLKNAIEASGLGQPDRSLVILRADRWPSGPKTAALVADFERLGGQVVAPGNDDFACFHALRQMLIDSDPRFASWLRSRRTASSTALLAPLPTGGP